MGTACRSAATRFGWMPQLRASVPCRGDNLHATASGRHVTHLPSASGCASGFPAPSAASGTRPGSRRCRSLEPSTKGVARGAECAQPADRRENAVVRLLQARPRRARAFKPICKAQPRKQPLARRHRSLGAEAMPRRRRSAPFNACTTRCSVCTADQRVQRKKRSRERDLGGALTRSSRSLNTSAPAAGAPAVIITRSPSSKYARVVHTNPPRR